MSRYEKKEPGRQSSDMDMIAVPRDLLPYLPLAREIERQVGEFAGDITAGDPAAFVDRIFDTLTEDGKAERIREAFENVPADEFLRLLRKRYADDESFQILYDRSLRQIAQSELAREAQFERELLVEKLRSSAESGVIDLGDIPQGTPYEIGLARDTPNDKFSVIGVGLKADTKPGIATTLYYAPYTEASVRLNAEAIKPLDIFSHFLQIQTELGQNRHILLGTVSGETDRMHGLEPTLYPKGAVCVDTADGLYIMPSDTTFCFMKIGDTTVFNNVH